MKHGPVTSTTTFTQWGALEALTDEQTPSIEEKFSLALITLATLILVACS